MSDTLVDPQTERIHKRITNAMKKRGMPYECENIYQFHSALASAGRQHVLVGETYHEDDYSHRYFVGYFNSLMAARDAQSAALASPRPRFIQSVFVITSQG